MDTEVRRGAAEAAAADMEIRSLEKALGKNEDLHEVLHSLLSTRLQRLDKLTAEDEKRQQAVKEKEEALRSTLQSLSEEERQQQEEAIFFKLGELQVQQKSVEAEQLQCKDGKSMTR